MTIRHGGEPLRDLDTRRQIHDLVIDFYREIVFDPVLGRVFGDVVEVDWAVHIPKLIDYWARVLLGDPGYNGYLLGPHQHVNDLEALQPDHFDRWHRLFVAAVDARWRGPYADAAKDHATRMAGTLARRILGVDWAPQALPLGPDGGVAGTSARRP